SSPRCVIRAKRSKPVRADISAGACYVLSSRAPYPHFRSRRRDPMSRTRCWGIIGILAVAQLGVVICYKSFMTDNAALASPPQTARAEKHSPPPPRDAPECPKSPEPAKTPETTPPGPPAPPVVVETKDTKNAPAPAKDPPPPPATKEPPVGAAPEGPPPASKD